MSEKPLSWNDKVAAAAKKRAKPEPASHQIGDGTARHQMHEREDLERPILVAQ